MANFIRNAAGALNRNNAQNPGQYPDCQQAPVYNVWPQPQAPPQSYIIYQQPQQCHMPSRYSEEAPKFDGHPWSLKRFFEEIEILAKECNLNQRDQIIHTLRYLDGPDYDLWRSIPASMADSWDHFKQEIMAIYPGAEDDTRTYATQSLPYTSHPAPYTSQTASYTLQPSPYTSQPVLYTSQLAPYTSSPFISQPAPYNPQPAPYSSQPLTYAMQTYPTTPAAQMKRSTTDPEHAPEVLPAPYPAKLPTMASQSAMRILLRP
ncbi:hypothetical protein P691DRAFT_767868 [Macrolepiota fuliginosa MF-IS2]|uniref:Uncharacterized protein n=1 Tax=Macrolepiota fuliginosa MF-IS2 TaxID=1400762 RepID=A0A9P6BV60_9AGAR|nr:hypothetical protein P691DRAFT_767868 [Macrolepiota fuliginosa MF-IS2]